MKKILTESDVLAAVMGGAILGGGGGGSAEAGERMARLALSRGPVELWSADEFSGDQLTATVALVGAPGAPNPVIEPEHMIRSVTLLHAELNGELAALHTNENGAETTVNGWMQAAVTGLPLLDLACNGRAHPTSLMGAMGLHDDPSYGARQGFSGGAADRYVEGTVSGTLANCASLVRHASVCSDGAVAVTRNPVTIAYAVANGAPGAISFAMAVGRAFLDGGMQAAAECLGGTLVASGRISSYRCEQREGLDNGHLRLDDAAATELPFINEYMLLNQHGERRASFPDLITTFDRHGRPLSSAHARAGDDVHVLHVPAARLPLSRTMFMKELYAPLQQALGISFGPSIYP